MLMLRLSRECVSTWVKTLACLSGSMWYVLVFFFSFFSDFPQCVILLTWHEMTNMASFLQGMEERAISETVEDTTVRIYLLKEQASADEQELSLQASGWRRIWIM